MRGRLDGFAYTVMALFFHLDAIFTRRQMAFQLAVDLGGFLFAISAAVAVHLAFVGFLRVVDVKEFLHGSTMTLMARAFKPCAAAMVAGLTN